MVRNMVKASFSGLMGAAMLVNSIIIKSAVKAPTFGQISGCTKGHGSTTKWMVLGFLHGLTAASMLANIKTITNRARDSISGPTAKDMKDSGEKATSMARV